VPRILLNRPENPSRKASRTVPVSLAWLGPPPLFEGEDTAAYDELLLARISGAIKPADIFEEVWVRDIVDLSWEVLRLRHLKASLMTATAYEGLHKILEPLLESYRERDQLVRGWAARDNTAIKRGSMGSASSSAPLQPMAEPQRIRGPNQSCVIASSFERYTTRVFSAGSSYAY
jgi:hypothetical protein